MANLARLIVPVIAALCVGTVASQAAGLAYLWNTGMLNSDKVDAFLAILHDVDVEEMRREAEQSRRPNNDEQPSFEAVVQARATKSLNLDLRESAIDKALADLRSLQDRLSTERRRYEEIKNSFEKQMTEMEQVSRDQDMARLRRMLESIHPRQAKGYIVKIVDDANLGDEKPLDDVVSLIKAMPSDKQKKIFTEFKTPEEAKRLHEILERIRRGEPQSGLFEETRDQLGDVAPEEES